MIMRGLLGASSLSRAALFLAMLLSMSADSLSCGFTRSFPALVVITFIFGVFVFFATSDQREALAAFGLSLVLIKNAGGGSVVIAISDLLLFLCTLDLDLSLIVLSRNSERPLAAI